MIVLMNPGISPDHEHVTAVVEKAKRHGLKPEVNAEPGSQFTAVQVFLKDGEVPAGSLPEYLFRIEGVEQVVRVSPAKVSAAMNGDGHRHIIKIGSSSIGPKQPCKLVVGPCAIDKHMPATIEQLAKLGITDVRGGFRKPRSRPEAFRGFGEDALEDLLRVAGANNIRSVWTEVIESPDIDIVRRLRDRTNFRGDIVLWVGARNTGNFRLLEKLGQQRDFKVMLKHGLAMTRIDEFLDMAGWVLYGPMWWDEDGRLDQERSAPSGNDNIIFCVRGLNKVDQHDPHRFHPNLSWIPVLHERSWAPVCLDPCHMAGRLALVFKVLAEGLTFNPDVVMVEAHAKPDEALCDKDQAVPTDRVPELIEMVNVHNDSRGYPEAVIGASAA